VEAVSPPVGAAAAAAAGGTAGAGCATGAIATEDTPPCGEEDGGTGREEGTLAGGKGGDGGPDACGTGDSDRPGAGASDCTSRRASARVGEPGCAACWLGTGALSAGVGGEG
jgi:hypothetical protein